CGTAHILAGDMFAKQSAVLRDIAAGKHLTTLAFSEKGSRSHFWAPVSQLKNGTITAEKSWVTSAGHADSYVVSTRRAGGTEPTDSTLYYVPKGASGTSVAGPWTGLGLRGNASAPMTLKNVAVTTADQLSADGKGFDA